MALIANSGHSNYRTSRATVRPGGFVAIVTLVLLCLSSINLPAQTEASGLSNRFLFIVETSRAMRPRAAGVFDAMKQALNSNLNGQIHQGDLVGIWTFNENVYQEMFPSQRWSQPTQLAFAVRLPTLANPQIYLKRAKLEKVMPELLKAISESENLTVVFVSSGEGKMQGTPFSAQINSAWKEWHDELEGIRMPLLTALRTRKGEPVDWLLTPAPRPLNLPALAADSKSDDEKGANPRGVVLESGLAEKKSEATTLPPEQQVAFSIWALGRTGFVASSSAPHGTSTPTNGNSTPGTPAVTPTGTEQSRIEPLTNDSSNVTAAVPLQEQTKSLPSPTRNSETSQIQKEDAAQTAAIASNDPGAAVPKPVELVFETNPPAPTSIAHGHEIAVNSKPPGPLPAVADPVVATQSRDILNQQLPVQARTISPGEEKRTVAASLPPSQRSFLHDNINPLCLMMVAAFGAAYSFRIWFLTSARAKGRAMSLTQSNKGESTDRPPAPASKSGGATVHANR